MSFKGFGKAAVRVSQWNHLEGSLVLNHMFHRLRKLSSKDSILYALPKEMPSWSS